MTKTSTSSPKSKSLVDKLGNSTAASSPKAGAHGHEKLAKHIARTLDDEKNLGLYVSYCRTYPLEIIQFAFAEARKRKPQEIKKSRGALFTYLVKLRARQSKKEGID